MLITMSWEAEPSFLLTKITDKRMPTLCQLSLRLGVKERSTQDSRTAVVCGHGAAHHQRMGQAIL